MGDEQLFVARLILCAVWDKLRAMTVRFPLLAGALCVLCVPVCAQVAPPAPTDAPLTVPIAPGTLDPNTQRVLDSNTPRQFLIRLRNVAPSLMAFWLDPKNHAAPALAPGQTPRFSPLGALSLPRSVDRIVAIDPTNVLLVLGTARGIAELQKIIAILDRPASAFVATESSAPLIAFQTTLFWLDTLDPDAKSLALAAPVARAATPAQLGSLERLLAKDRATRRTLLAPAVSSGDTTEFSLSVYEQGLLLPGSPHLPDSFSGGQFHYPAPSTENQSPPFLVLPNSLDGHCFDYSSPVLISAADTQPDDAGRLVPQPFYFQPRPRSAFGAGIDPGFVFPRSESASPDTPDLLRLRATQNRDKTLSLRLETASGARSAVVLRQGESLIFSGSARDFGLTPPSARFGSFVVRITPSLIVFGTPHLDSP